MKRLFIIAHFLQQTEALSGTVSANLENNINLAIAFEEKLAQG